ncbi:MAG: AAA family ATPase [Ignavibacteriaceae bacterium]|nr:AAA family ATPase [Ignavibacteriaceae bacterium]
MIGQIDRILELERKQKKEEHTPSKNIVAILSGKGGTGKTFLASNLAFLFAKNHGKVLLIDLDYNLSNLNYVFNQSINKTINSFLENIDDFESTITNVTQNLDVIFGESGKVRKTNLSESDIDRIYSHLNKIENKYDLILLDLGAGASSEILYAVSKSCSAIIVTTPEPPAIIDSYVVSKLLYLNYGYNNIYAVINNCNNNEEGTTAFENLRSAVTHFLGIDIKCLSIILNSSDVRQSLMQQKLFAQSFNEHTILTSLDKALSGIIKNLQLFNINHFENQNSFKTA